MRLVIVESPYAGDVFENERYARAALRDCLARGEAPLASHLLYTQPGVLDDTLPSERAAGIAAGLAWGEKAELSVVYIDRGLSEDMIHGMIEAVRSGRQVQARTLGDAWATEPAVRAHLHRFGSILERAHNVRAREG